MALMWMVSAAGRALARVRMTASCRMVRVDGMVRMGSDEADRHQG